MNIHRPPTATPPPAEPSAPSHRRQSSRSASISSSSVLTVKPPASLPLSLRDATPNPDSQPPHRPASPPPTARRRSSAANAPAESGPGAFAEGAANINRWSQSTTSSTTSPKDRDKDKVKDREKGHAHHPSFSRKLSISTTAPLSTLTTTTNTTNGAAALPNSPSRRNSSPSRNNSNNNKPNHHNAYTSNRSPASSPRRTRARSPIYGPPSSVIAPPNTHSLGPILLPATVYDPNTPPSASTTNTPSTSGLITPSLLTGNQRRDYFNSKPLSPLPPNQRPPSRSQIEKVLGKSPLGSPAIIGAQESDRRHDSTSVQNENQNQKNRRACCSHNMQHNPTINESTVVSPPHGSILSTSLEGHPVPLQYTLYLQADYGENTFEVQVEGQRPNLTLLLTLL
ncbi:uncharacterized protein K460DRAFT_76813 [Cucurbitaria berberidis CBS 394.84]|uniref:Uncharacterized protein n=1 Tax=Cucurbitaria berberidis CBS 394.84 TaxID=1168544 RepID=A0A9P4GP34_9PLEO|nr:uncharacterized protein K460DRAFT_76813 [Cucurbitaria berberidis CBS 394.84]KAF1848545.1 hypothetical protein K460DRAFT_76813 [Cucurbitaria berberidis CBS 394.84]